jgi:NH3-dependent NAD+ synthetase
MLKTSYTYTTKYGDKTVEPATTFDINKTLMRCLVKNLAMFGLGIYIYAGEDLPEAEVSTPAPAKAKPTTGLIDLAVDDANWNGVVKYAKDNKALGFDKIGQQLSRKYNLSNEVKQALVDLLK